MNCKFKLKNSQKGRREGQKYKNNFFLIFEFKFIAELGEYINKQVQN